MDHGARPVIQRLFYTRCTGRVGTSLLYGEKTNFIKIFRVGWRARRSYHKLDNREEDVKLSINRMELQRGILNRSALDQQEDAASEGIAHTALTYERNLSTAEQQKSTITELLEAFDLEPRPVSTTVKKIAGRPRSEIINNYEEARSWADRLTT